MNTLGHFVVVDENFLHSFDKRMAWVLVEIDVSCSMLEDIDIICNDLTIC